VVGYWEVSLKGHNGHFPVSPLLPGHCEVNRPLSAHVPAMKHCTATGPKQQSQKTIA
jgi:hypothetical protein